MPLTIGEKIKVMLKRKNMTMGDLAEKMSTSRQNLSNKVSRDNFSEKESKEIAAALGFSYDTVFTDLETGDII